MLEYVWELVIDNGVDFEDEEMVMLYPGWDIVWDGLFDAYLRLEKERLSE